ncbi:MAG: prolipoprotein diacylglyceryl transferase [Hellea sp.]|nr:prolipoprotein diacylglyceryl transferase [Hellea sp.]
MIFNLIYAIRFPDWISDTAIPLPGPLSIKWYGLAYIVGIYLAFLWAARTVKKKEVWIPEGVTRGSELIPNKRLLEDFTFYCLLGIIVGGRLGYVLLYRPEFYFSSPVDIFKVWDGGMAFHGGFAGVCLAVWAISRKYKISLWRWADMAAIGAPLGLGLVRLANFANQELPGRVTDVPWAFKFWAGDNDQLPRHPSQLYEAFLEGLVIFLILWFLARKKKALTKPGICAGMFFLLYGLFRFGVEFVREPDSNPIIEGLTRGMTYSLPMVFIGLAIVWWAAKRPPVAPKHMPDDASPSAKTAKAK